MKKIISVILAAVMLTAAMTCAVFAYHLLGDVNDDGTVDNKDVVALFRSVSGNSSAAIEEYCDVNADGSIDNKDVAVLFRSASATSAGAGEEWAVGDYVDVTGEKTGEHYIYTIQYGTFVREDVEDGVLYGAVMIDDDDEVPLFTLKLFEGSVENLIVNNSAEPEYYAISVKTSVGMVLNTTGAMFSGDSGIYIDFEDAPILMYELYNGKDVTFTIIPDKYPARSYVFTVFASNYRSVIPLA